VLIARYSRVYAFIFFSQSSTMRLSTLATFDHLIFSARFFPPGTASAGAH